MRVVAALGLLAAFVSVPVEGIEAACVADECAATDAPTLIQINMQPGLATESTLLSRVLEAVREGRIATIGMQLVQHYAGQRPQSQEPDELTQELILELEVVSYIVVLLAYIFISLVIALAYKANRTWPVRHEGSTGSIEMKEWSSGIFDCFSQPMICLCACCCCPIRYADSVSHVDGMWGFWAIFAIMLTAECLMIFVVPLLGMLTALVICVYVRQKIRSKFGMESGTCFTVCGDCLLWTFCNPCTTAQEARHLEAASLVGHPAIVKPTST
mmetsp:Transcript_66198/g.123588  ORF Transcript_66198/g.123588 Transcript_66198/m.123588 type:complete len:272 (-) Transcript_66198:97-912(-)